MDGTPMFHPMSFGGWPSYQEWADHDFVPRPLDDMEDEPHDGATPADETVLDTSTPEANDPTEDPSPDDWPPDDNDIAALHSSGSVPLIAGPPPTLDWPEGSPLDSREPSASSARPYVRTRGRTQAGHDLRLETLVSAARFDASRPDARRVNHDHHVIWELCRTPKSVAEIAAHIQAPIGVTRVLISDAITARLLIIHEPAPIVDGAPSMDLMQRVLEGLHRLS